MAYLNNVRDGRQSKVYLLSFGTTAITSGFVKGKLYCYASKASTSPAFANLEAGDLFIFNQSADPTLGSNFLSAQVGLIRENVS